LIAGPLRPERILCDAIVYYVSVRATASKACGIPRSHRSGGLELSQSFVAELVANTFQEVAAAGFGIEKLPILLLGKLEVAINLAAPEAQVQDVLAGIVADEASSLDSKACQSISNLRLHFELLEAAQTAGVY
jgi:hypothetical protein